MSKLSARDLMLINNLLCNLNSIALCYSGPLRRGQEIFNRAKTVLPKQTSKLQDDWPAYDCFYDDSKIDLFLGKLSEICLKGTW